MQYLHLISGREEIARLLAWWAEPMIDVAVGACLAEWASLLHFDDVKEDADAEDDDEEEEDDDEDDNDDEVDEAGVSDWVSPFVVFELGWVLVLMIVAPVALVNEKLAAAAAAAATAVAFK